MRKCSVCGALVLARDEKRTVRGQDYIVRYAECPRCGDVGVWRVIKQCGDGAWEIVHPDDIPGIVGV